ncbi:MAG TPA: PLP-dependent aminotransferase family protein, partial [Ktedonobacterales bacterium]
LYRQVADQVRDLIRRGVLSPGSRLPTVRQLARDLGLTRLTVHSAYGELHAQGLVEATVGRGTFVAAHPLTVRPTSIRPAPAPQPPASWLSQGDFAELGGMIEQPGLLSFAQAVPAPETYPVRELERALRVVPADPSALSYGPMQGEAALRGEVSRLLLERGVIAPPEGVLITSGAQQGIDLVLRAFAAPHDVVLVEEPTYPGAIELAAQRGQRIVGIPRDEDGLSLTVLEATCQLYHPRLLYLIPTFHNPSGVSLPEAQRADLLRLARKHELLLLEDDVYGWLAVDGPAPLPLKAEDEDGQVIYATSFSKALAPGLRLGALVAAETHMPRLVAAKYSSDLISSPLVQRALAEYLRRGSLDRHLRHVRVLYGARRDAMLDALERFVPGCAWTRPAGGLSIWLTLPEDASEREVYAALLARGVAVAPGRAFFPHPVTRGFLRLSFGSHPPHEIQRAIEVLGRVLIDQRKRHSEAVARAGREVAPLV